MSSFQPHHAQARGSRNRSLRLGLIPALALALPWLICGCDGKNSGNASPAVRTAEDVQASSPALTVFDLAGYQVDPFDATDAKAVVFIFVSVDCPISNRYAPEIRRIEEDFARSGVRFWLVYADTDISIEGIRKHINDYRLPSKALRDPQHGLVRLCKVHVTPEAAVFLPGRRLVYHGRIDNRYADLGKERPEATQRDLQNVLEAILQGKPVPYPTARAVGCYISELK
jgi:hypothetical protein